ncbi:MAG: SRPBCC family protein [Bacteroidetes bacterium]|nr:SRPBCC family protein [Bacteroidota bacterium]
MKILKYTLLGLLGLIVALLLLALIVKSDYSMERSVEINKPRSDVFAYLKMLRNHEQFTVWPKMDPDIKTSYKGTDGTVGAVYYWEGPKMGKGEQEITQIAEDKRIDYALRFKEPMEADDTAYFLLEDSPKGGTLVKWGFAGKMPYPMNLMLLFMDMEEMMGKDLQQGLDNLKEILEKS